jgi:hypothetical protein
MPLLRQNHALRRILELDAQTAKLVDNSKIDGLLQVEQGIEIGLPYEVREPSANCRAAAVAPPRFYVRGNPS